MFLPLLLPSRRLGIPTVAVYSEADRASLHVQHADEAFCVGPAPARDSYLRMDRILEVGHPPEHHARLFSTGPACTRPGCMSLCSA